MKVRETTNSNLSCSCKFIMDLLNELKPNPTGFILLFSKCLNNIFGPNKRLWMWTIYLSNHNFLENHHRHETLESYLIQIYKRFQVRMIFEYFENSRIFYLKYENLKIWIFCIFCNLMKTKMSRLAPYLYCKLNPLPRTLKVLEFREQ